MIIFIIKTLIVCYAACSLVIFLNGFAFRGISIKNGQTPWLTKREILGEALYWPKYVVMLPYTIFIGVFR